jgi:hypothetical protein
VPRDHFYRQLEAKLDLGFVREVVRDLYEPTGRPSIDPVVFFKLQLIMFFEGIRSERQLIEVARLNLAHRWYLGWFSDIGVGWGYGSAIWSCLPRWGQSYNVLPKWAMTALMRRARA